MGVGALTAARDFRNTFGFRSDTAYLETAASDLANFNNDEWGVPLNGDEAAEMDRRVQVQQAIRPAILYASAEQGYAEVYLDQSRDAVPVFLFRSRDDARTDHIRSLLPANLLFEVDVVDHSLTELTATKSSVVDSVGALSAQGIDVVSASVHVALNRVEVGVSKLTEAARVALGELAPGALVSEESLPVADACEIYSCGPGMRGGLKIDSPDEPNYCTSGYVGKLNGSSSSLVLVTAGHCIASHASTVGHIWTHNGSAIGTENYASTGWQNGSLADVGYITLNSASKVSPFDRVLVKQDTNQVVQATDQLFWFEQVEGTAACRMGAGSYYYHSTDSYYTARKCGTIVIYDTDSDGTTDRNSQSCVATTNVPGGSTT